MQSHLQIYKKNSKGFPNEKELVKLLFRKGEKCKIGKVASAEDTYMHFSVSAQNVI